MLEDLCQGADSPLQTLCDLGWPRHPRAPQLHPETSSPRLRRLLRGFNETTDAQTCTGSRAPGTQWCSLFSAPGKSPQHLAPPPLWCTAHPVATPLEPARTPPPLGSCALPPLPTPLCPANSTPPAGVTSVPPPRGAPVPRAPVTLPQPHHAAVLSSLSVCFSVCVPAGGSIPDGKA